jgi:hypothetical protein
MVEPNEQNPDEGQPTTYSDTPPDDGAEVAATATPKPKRATRTPPPVPDTQAIFATNPPAATVSVGRTVHFMIPKAMHQGDGTVHRPAIVSRVGKAKKGVVYVDLHVFVLRDDYPGNYHPGPIMVAENVAYSDDESDGTWHWPERV